VGSRLQIHESKYESVARFRIHTPWKRSFMEETNWLVHRSLHVTAMSTIDHSNVSFKHPVALCNLT
jgi:hypothetical protein